jgi:hypothetical protein
VRRALLSCLIAIAASIAVPVSAAPGHKPTTTLSCHRGLALVYRVGKNSYPAGSPQFERAARAFAAGSANLTGTFTCMSFLPDKGGVGGTMPTAKTSGQTPPPLKP